MQPRPRLPAPCAAFGEKKARILQQLGVPEAEYLDASPKGSVDEGIRHLIDEINRAEGFVTTSSCAGRVSVFLEGRKTPTAALGGEAQAGEAQAEEPRREQVAGVGGKGAGGTWLYVSHEPVDGPRADALGFAEPAVCLGSPYGGRERRLIHFKFEPMILHVLTTSLAHGQLVLHCALQAGFRESGAINLTCAARSQSATPMVAVRSTGLGFESLVGYETPDGRRHQLVSAECLATLFAIGNERFSENAKRIARFRAAFCDALTAPPPRRNPEGRAWEDALARSERMRAEGLRRKTALAAERDEMLPQSADQPT